MTQSGESRSLRDYLRVLRQRRLLIITAMALAAAAALAYAAVKEPEYESTATISFQDANEDLEAIGAAVSEEFQPEKRAAAGAKVVTRDDVVDRVKEALETDRSSDELKSSVTTAVEPDSNLVQITAVANDADFSAALANEFAKQTRDVRGAEEKDRIRKAATELQDELDRLPDAEQNSPTAQAYREGISRLLTLGTLTRPVEIARPAEVPGSPASPQPIRDTILAAFLGLMLGVGIAFLRHALDRRLNDSHEAQRQLGMPLVGYVRKEALGQVGLGTNGSGDFSDQDLEAFRVLRTNFDFLAKDRDLRSVVVTSSLPEEGKSTVAAWFAYASAVAGRRTLLIECDFRRPVLAERLGVDASPGLSEYLGGSAKPREILRSIEVEGRSEVDILPCIVAGDNVFQPTEMLGSKRFGDFLDQVTKAYQLVVIDAAPLLPVGDTLELLPQVDAALFCVRLGQTTRDQAMNAKQALEHLPDKPIGLVVTGIQRGSDDDYYGYYSYSPPIATGAQSAEKES